MWCRLSVRQQALGSVASAACRGWAAHAQQEGATLCGAGIVSGSRHWGRRQACVQAACMDWAASAQQEEAPIKSSDPFAEGQAV